MYASTYLWAVCMRGNLGRSFLWPYDMEVIGLEAYTLYADRTLTRRGRIVASQMHLLSTYRCGLTHEVDPDLELKGVFIKLHLLW